MNEQIAKALTGFVAQLLPEAILGVAACIFFLGSTWKKCRRTWGMFALASLLFAIAALFWQTGPSVDAALAKNTNDPEAMAALYNAPVIASQLGFFFKALALGTGLVLVLLGWHEGGDEHAGEYHACLLLITLGTCLAGSANDLVTLFLSLELVSIPTYVLLYLPRTGSREQEAAMKYFLLSVFSSGLLLFGFSYLYGVTGTTNIPGILDAVAATSRDQARAAPWRGLVMVGLVMVVAGLGFRITAFPFHYYAPDVYEGTTVPSAALLSFVPKVAGFAALIKVLGFVPAALGGSAGLALGNQVPLLLWIMAAVTMTLGNILALWQDNLRRLLAYSSIANAGYMLIGLVAAPRLGESGGVEALLFYLVAYGAMTVGAFAILELLSAGGKPVETIDDLAGLGRSHPALALTMMLFLLSLIGIPLTAGFFGKFQLFLAAMGPVVGTIPANPQEATKHLYAEQARLYAILAVIAALNAAIAAWYYLKLAVAMYLRDGIEPLPRVKPAPALAAVVACAALTIGLGVVPTPVLDALRGAMGRPREAAGRLAPDQPERHVGR